MLLRLLGLLGAVGSATSRKSGGGTCRKSGGLVHYFVSVDGGLGDVLGEMLLYSLSNGDESLAVNNWLDLCEKR